MGDSNKQSFNVKPNDHTCVWIFCQGDAEEDIAMWEEASTSFRSLPRTSEEQEEEDATTSSQPSQTPPAPPRKQKEVKQCIKIPVSPALERARQRNSVNLPLSPNSYLNHQGEKMTPTPEQAERRLKVRRSMVSALSMQSIINAEDGTVNFLL